MERREWWWVLGGDAALLGATARGPKGPRGRPGSSAPDVYSVVFHSAEAHVVTAGHDRTVRLYDVDSEQVCVLPTPPPVPQAYSSVLFSLAFAFASKLGSIRERANVNDLTLAIKFWDVMSGVCVKTLR